MQSIIKFLNRVFYGGTYKVSHQSKDGTRKVFWCDTDHYPINDPKADCWARTTSGGYLAYGPTHLIAAMRCYVTSKLGKGVEVPSELLEYP